MRLPNNSLGVSDAKQFMECPKLFYRNMARHLRPEGAPDDSLIAQNSEVLSYGSAVHDAALIVVKNPDVYLDDAVDAAWAKWAPYLQPEHHAEMREDVKVVIDRTIEAQENLELVCAEEDWKFPVFVGRPQGDAMLDEEEGEWYYYRFRIDALYRRKDDPTHYIIRDFKTVRRERWQSDIDEDMQFTAYDYGVRQALGDGVENVTLWYDQLKFGEVFSSRTDSDRMKFEEYIQSTIKAVLDMPAEEVMDTFKLNQFCGWCPLLTSCGVVDYANDLAAYEIGMMSKADPSKVPDITPYIERYELSKKAVKALDEYNTRMSDFLKNNPGRHGETIYVKSTVNTPKWDARDVYGIVGDQLLDNLPLVSKKAISEYLNDPDFSEQLTKAIRSGGYEKLTARPVKDE